jgi:hypothetical protein
MIDPSEYDDIIVTVAHPASDVEETLNHWIATGPGPRPFVRIVKARRKSTNEPVDMTEIPLEYRNTRESRRLQRLGELPAPWGPPPDDRPLDPDMPEHIRRLVDE